MSLTTARPHNVATSCLANRVSFGPGPLLPRHWAGADQGRGTEPQPGRVQFRSTHEGTNNLAAAMPIQAVELGMDPLCELFQTPQGSPISHLLANDAPALTEPELLQNLPSWRLSWQVKMRGSVRAGKASD